MTSTISTRRSRCPRTRGFPIQARRKTSDNRPNPRLGLGVSHRLRNPRVSTDNQLPPSNRVLVLVSRRRRVTRRNKVIRRRAFPHRAFRLISNSRWPKRCIPKGAGSRRSKRRCRSRVRIPRSSGWRSNKWVRISRNATPACSSSSSRSLRSASSASVFSSISNSRRRRHLRPWRPMRAPHQARLYLRRRHPHRQQPPRLRPQPPNRLRLSSNLKLQRHPLRRCLLERENPRARPLRLPRPPRLRLPAAANLVS